MNTLYFAKLDRKDYSKQTTTSKIVLLFTSESEETAKTQALSLVSESCRDQYMVEKVEAVCRT